MKIEKQPKIRFRSREGVCLASLGINPLLFVCGHTSLTSAALVVDLLWRNFFRNPGVRERRQLAALRARNGRDPFELFRRHP